jgi:uncharacterized protein (TIGR03545 family)/uncharacterized protein (TIGR03546 family)
MFLQIRKLFKALNSTANVWQMSGAIVLAMFAGFLPSSSLILLFILFLALILNVNFGIFLLFSVIFSGIGYIFDPVFESIGYSILTDNSMQSFFTNLYNSSIFRWTSFNYTLVTGSLVVSAVLALPMLFILNKFISLYRVQIGERLNQFKLTKWMNLFNEEAKSNSVFRWWGLGGFGALAVFIAVIFIFLFDPLMRLTLEKSLSYSLQTEVDIKDFSSDFSDLKVRIDGIEIADKDKLTHNLLQLESISFDLGFSALIEKKAMVEHLEVKALAFNEKRDKAAKAYSEEKSAKQDQDKGSSEQTGKQNSETKALQNPFSMPDVDDILAKEELKSVSETKALKADIEKTKQKWADISSELKSQNEIEELKNESKKIQDIFKSGDITKIASAKDDLEKLKTKVSNLKEKYTRLKKEFNDDKKRIQKQISQLKNLPQKDIARLKKKYSLDANGGANIIGTLIDDKAGHYVKQALKYYEMIRPYIKSDSAEDEPQESTPPRGQGRWIKYANLSNIPSVVIKDAKIEVKLKNDTLLADVKDFSSNQKLYKKPMRLHVDAKGKDYKKIFADVVDDRTGDSSKTSFDIKVNDFKADSYKLESISMNDILSDGSLNGKIVDKIIDAESKIQIKKVKLQMASQEMINELLDGISEFDVDIELSGDVEKPNIKVQSNLDKKLSSGLSKVVNKATKEFEKKLSKGIMDKFGAQSQGISSNIGDIDSLLDSKTSALNGIDLSSATSGSGLIKKFF